RPIALIVVFKNRPITNTTGHLIDFRQYAEMGGIHTQYQLAKINEKETLTSQWLHADGDPLWAVDVV
ncbi:TPA: hypothetical protein ACF37P_005160, partial [Escherichia coli]